MCALPHATSNNGRQQFLQLSLTQHHRFYSQHDHNDGSLRHQREKKKTFPGAASLCTAASSDTRMPG